MSINYSLPYRQVHLDFHTSPHILDVGHDFDAQEFTRTMKNASVNSVTVFAKCHHGHLYYKTSRPERHPGLRAGLDLTGEQIEALHAEGIRAPVYISIQVDEYAANTYPQWKVVNPDGTLWKGWGRTGVFEPGWQLLDMSSPYQEFVYEQTVEILEAFKPVDGIFFDMCWDQPSASPWAITGMKAKGMDPKSETDRDEYARQVALAYMERFYNLVKSTSPYATVYFNGRTISKLPQDIDYLEQVEIEALPTGGWGYMYFPVNVRYARTVCNASAFPKPTMGMTARFHRTWGDFGGLKPYPALEYETSQMMAHGSRCSIGDQLHPRGTLDKGAYELIGKAYKRVKDREPWLEGARPIAQIGLFQLPTSSLQTTQNTSRTDEGATRLLIQLKHQFDVVQATSDLDAYELLVLPDSLLVDNALKTHLEQYLAKGGKILASGTSGISPDGKDLLLPALGIEPEGFSPFTATYIHFNKGIARGVPETDHVVYEAGVRARAGAGAETLAHVVEPYFERNWDHFCSHNQTPPDRVTDYVAAAQNGNVIYISYPIFRLFAEYGNASHRLLVRNCLNLLLPEPLLKMEPEQASPVVVPSGLETSLTRQGERIIVHLLYYAPERRTPGLDLVEDIVPLYNLPLQVRLDTTPRIVYLAPEKKELEYQLKDGYAHVVVPELRGHAIVVFE